jgi:hypothetical protein
VSDPVIDPGSHDLGPRYDVGAGKQVVRQTYAGDRPATRGRSDAERRREPVRAETPLTIRFEVRTLGGDAGRALAAAQGRVVRRLLAIVAEMEVGEGDQSDRKEVAR